MAFSIITSMHGAAGGRQRAAAKPPLYRYKRVMLPIMIFSH